MKKKDLFDCTVEFTLLQKISKDFARRYNVFPLSDEGNKVLVAMANPNDFHAITELRLLLNKSIDIIQYSEKEIQEKIVRDYPSDIVITEESGEDERDTNSDFMISESEDDGPIIKLVNSLLFEAIDQGGSDIHFDPQDKNMKVRVRSDGQLQKIADVPKSMQAAIISRLKIMATMNITETRLPQDGRSVIRRGTRVVDLRVSALPTIHGEKIVIRILDRSVGIRKLEDFYFEPEVLKTFRKMMNEPHGMLLVTGPTGSGKSSTLYAALNERNTPDVNVITVEDPVEFQLAGLNQVLVNSKVGLTFASGLRSILRQDPDIIMVGEIRDSETAEIAIKASMTGHLVLSTLHTNSAIATVGRLLDMKVDPFLVASALSGVLAQRLVRTICQSCKEKTEVSANEKIFIEKYNLQLTHLYRGKGCLKCKNTGYKGRMAIQELLHITPELRTVIANGGNNEELLQISQRNGMKFLFDDAIRKVVQGYTTFEEAMKVVVSE